MDRASDDSTPETVEVLDGLVVRRLPMPLPASHWSAIHRSAVTGTRTLLALRSAVAAFRPDVLHVQCYGPNGAYAPPLVPADRAPPGDNLHGETVMDDSDIFEVSRVLRSSLRSGLRSAAAVTGCSAFTLADAEDRFRAGARPRGRVIPNGVDLGEERHSAGSTIKSSPVHFTSAEGRPDGPYLFALGRVSKRRDSICCWRPTQQSMNATARRIW